MAADRADYEALIKILEDMVTQCDNIGVTVSAGSSNSLSILTSSFNGMVSNIQKVDTISRKFENVMIPHDVIALVDRGRNPDLYMGNFIKDSFKLMELFRSKLHVYSYFLECLKNKLKQTCPEMLAIYQMLNQQDVEQPECHINGVDSQESYRI